MVPVVQREIVVLPLRSVLHQRRHSLITRHAAIMNFAWTRDEACRMPGFFVLPILSPSRSRIAQPDVEAFRFPRHRLARRFPSGEIVAPMIFR